MGNSPINFVREKTSDFLLSADGANIEYNNIGEILPTLQTNRETAEPDNFAIRWEKYLYPY